MKTAYFTFLIWLEICWFTKTCFVGLSLKKKKNVKHFFSVNILQTIADQRLVIAISALKNYIFHQTLTKSQQFLKFCRQNEQKLVRVRVQFFLEILIFFKNRTTIQTNSDIFENVKTSSLGLHRFHSELSCGFREIIVWKFVNTHACRIPN